MKPYLTIFLFLTIAFTPTANAQIPGTQNFWAEAAAATGSLPAGMTITNADQNKYVASIYDTDYDTAPDPLPEATLDPIAADGTDDDTVDVQGVIGIPGSGDELTITLNYTATSEVDYPEYSETVTVPSELIEGGGDPIDITLSYPAGTTEVGDGTITATIAAASTLNVKQLDVYGGGFNDPTPGYPLASFSLSTDDSGGDGTVGVRIMSGLPDREFGDGLHDFLYVPVVAEDGNTWLNHNLGAHYTDVNHPSFNLTQQATAYNDHLAYGSLYQWGRYSDGHELITWTSGTAGTPVNNAFTDIKSDNPTTSDFIITGGDPYTSDWRVNQDDSLWSTESSPNNPCPQGYRLPSPKEQVDLLSAASITDGATAASSALALPLSGFRNNLFDGLQLGANRGHYQSNSGFGSDPDDASTIQFRLTSVVAEYKTARTQGNAVRCIKD